MNTERELPGDVIAELQANGKISAIKLLRRHQGIGLKEAKDIIDAYENKLPASTRHQAPKSENGLARLLMFILGAGIIYGVYRYFT